LRSIQQLVLVVQPVGAVGVARTPFWSMVKEKFSAGPRPAAVTT
jgi:hypothetical protein